MTEKEVNDITQLRKLNYTHSFIANYLGMPVSNVKSYCSRYGIQPMSGKEDIDPPEHINVCKECGKVIIQKTKRKKEYCSSYCRRSAWRDRQKIKKRLDFNPASSDELDGGKNPSKT